MSDIKRPGCCTLCDSEVFEVIARAPDGTAKQLGAPLPTAYRAHYRLSNHAVVTLTMCADCIGEAKHLNLQDVWEKCLRSHAHYSGADHPDVAELLEHTLLGVVMVERWPNPVGERIPI